MIWQGREKNLSDLNNLKLTEKNNVNKKKLSVFLPLFLEMTQNFIPKNKHYIWSLPTSHIFGWQQLRPQQIDSPVKNKGLQGLPVHVVLKISRGGGDLTYR